MNADLLAVCIIFILFMCLIGAVVMYLRYVSAKVDTALKCAERALETSEANAGKIKDITDKRATEPQEALTEADKREIRRAMQIDEDYRTLIAMRMPPMVNHAAGVRAAKEVADDAED